MNLTELLGSPWLHRLGWTLLHSLWEVAAVAAVLGLALHLARRRGPQARYLAAILGMTAALGASAATFFLVSPPAQPAVGSSGAMLPLAEAWSGSRRVVVSADPCSPQAAPGSTRGAMPLPVLGEGHVDPRHASPPGPGFAKASPGTGAGAWHQAREAVRPYLPYLVAVWLAGVAALSLWRLGGWIAAMRLRVIGTQPVGAEVASLAARLARRLKLTRPVRILQSLVAQTPMVIGWLRPVILLPLSAVTGLAPAQLEAVLAHEMAHIRRYDYLANLLQTVVETLFFYHPAAWWISRRLRIERERCCDDVAVRLCGDRIHYAEALTAVEEVRPPAPGEAIDAGCHALTRLRGRAWGRRTCPSSKTRKGMAAAGTAVVSVRGAGGRDLIDRIRRVLGLPGEAPHTAARSVAGAVAVAALLAVLVGLQVSAGGSDVPKTATQPSTAPGTQPDLKLPQSKPGELVPGVGSQRYLLGEADCIFVGKVRKVDWALPKPEPVVTSGLNDWGTAEFECVEPISGLKAGQVVPVTVLRQHAFVTREFIPEHMIFGRVSIEAGTQWLVFVKKGGGFGQEGSKSRTQAGLRAAALIETGKEPIIERVREAVRIQLLPPDRQFDALSALLAKDAAVSGRFLYSYASEQILHTKADPSRIALAMNAGVTNPRNDDLTRKGLLVQVNELWREFLDDKKDDRLALTLQQMLLEDSPVIAAIGDEQFIDPVDTIPYVFHSSEDKSPYTVPDALPKGLTLSDPARIAASLRAIVDRLEKMERRTRALFKTPEDAAKGGMQWQLDHYVELRAGLTKLAGMVERIPPATQPADRRTTGPGGRPLPADVLRLRQKYADTPDWEGPLSHMLKVRVEANSWDELVARVKPSLTWGLSDLGRDYPVGTGVEHPADCGFPNMLWIEAGPDGKPVFRIARAYIWKPTGRAVRWVIADMVDGNGDELGRNQLSGRPMSATLHITKEPPGGDHPLSYAIVKGSAPRGGTVYEIGWERDSFAGNGWWEALVPIFVWRDAAGRWQLFGEGPEDWGGKASGGVCNSTGCKSTIRWRGDPPRPVVSFVRSECTSEVGEEHKGLPILSVCRDATLDAAAGELPAKLAWSNHEYVVAGKDSNLDTVINDLAVWSWRGWDDRRQLRELILRLNPKLTEAGAGAIPEGTRIVVYDHASPVYPVVRQDNAPATLPSVNTTKPAAQPAKTQPAGSTLEFRIAPSGSSGDAGFTLDAAELKSYTDWLDQGKIGPWWKDANGVAGRIRGRMPKYLWLPVRGDANDDYQQLITGQHGGKTYLLVCDDPNRSMVPSSDPSRAWGLKNIYSSRDDRGRPMIGVDFDAGGAELFAALTATNLRSALAIIVDGEVLSASIIQSKIRSSCVITGRFSQADVDKLVTAIRRGMPPVAQPPTAQPTTGPTSDGDRRRKLAEDALKIEERQLASLRQQVEAGRSSTADLAQQEVKVAEARLRVEELSGRPLTEARKQFAERLLELEERQLARLRSLYDAGMIAEVEVDRQELKVAEAKQRLADAAGTPASQPATRPAGVASIAFADANSATPNSVKCIIRPQGVIKLTVTRFMMDERGQASLGGNWRTGPESLPLELLTTITTKKERIIVDSRLQPWQALADRPVVALVGGTFDDPGSKEGTPEIVVNRDLKRLTGQCAVLWAVRYVKDGKAVKTYGCAARAREGQEADDPGPTPEELTRCAAAFAAQLPAHGAADGRAKEAVLKDRNAGDDCFLDLDRGRVFSLPKELRDYAAKAREYCRANEIDLLAVPGRDADDLSGPRAGERGTIGLSPVDISARIVDAGLWDANDVEILAEAAKELTPNPGFSAVKGYSLPPTFVVKTREGGIGILRILERRNDAEPRSVRFAYRMVKADVRSFRLVEAGESSTRPAVVKTVRNFVLKDANAESAAEMLRPQFLASVIAVDVRTNSMVVSATADEMEKIAAAVVRLDKPAATRPAASQEANHPPQPKTREEAARAALAAKGAVAPPRIAVYLVTNTNDTRLAEKATLSELELAKDPALRDGDFVSYDANTRALTVSAEAAKRFPRTTSVWGMPYVVVVEGRRWFLGCSMPMGSSYVPKVPVAEYGVLTKTLELKTSRPDDVADVTLRRKITEALKSVGQRPATQPAEVLAAIERVRSRVAGLKGKHPALEGVGDARAQVDEGSTSSRREVRWEFSRNATEWGKAETPSAVDSSKPFCRIILYLWTHSASGEAQPVAEQRTYQVGGVAWDGYVKVWSSDAALVKAVKDIVDEELARPTAATVPVPATSPAAAPELIGKWIAQLGDDSPQVREAAGRELAAVGAPARPALQAAADGNDLERSQRAREVLDDIRTRTARWAIYVVTDPPDGLSAQKKPLADLKLADRPVLTDEEIEWYDADKHTLAVTEAGRKRLAPGPRPRGVGEAFVVVADGNRIYQGGFVSIIASVAPNGPLIDLSLANRGAKPLAIAKPRDPRGGDDPRGDERIARVLRELKKLRPASQPGGKAGDDTGPTPTRN